MKTLIFIGFLLSCFGIVFFLICGASLFCKIVIDRLHDEEYFEAATIFALIILIIGLLLFAVGVVIG